MRRALKWAGITLGGILGLIVVALAAVYALSERHIRRSYDDIPEVALAIRSDSATLARGKHVATIRGCVDCHTPTLAGQLFLDEPMIGRVYAPNLTSGRGGIGGSYTEVDWLRSIRHGVGPDRHPLIIMPSHEYNVLSDADVEALIAYLRGLPPVDNEVGTNRVGPLGRVLFLAGKIPLLPAELIDHTRARETPPAPGPTAAYGAYLASSCVGCHGESFSGGPVPGMPPSFPPAANITPHPQSGIGQWTEEDFFHALRQGKRPDGTVLRPEMPWALTSQMTDDEIRALWRYLQTVPAKEG